VRRRLPLRAGLLALAALAAAVAAFQPMLERRVTVHDLMLVVDVTGSMNARDGTLAGRPASRLDVVKAGLVDLLAHLDCGSRIGLSIFTERRSFVLFLPVEVCENAAPVAGALARLDWRMAFEGDSHVTVGLHDALRTAAAGGFDVVFLTDGHEAPPLPWTGGPAFDGPVGAVRGLVVGVGGPTPVQIPKFDDAGREAGVWGPDDVPQESRLGPPPPGAENRPGWHPRNNPYGEVVGGTEHLTSLRSDHLDGLAAGLGLGFTRLTGGAELAATVARTLPGRTTSARVPIDGWFGRAALGLLAAALLAPGLTRLARRRAAVPRPRAARSHPRSHSEGTTMVSRLTRSPAGPAATLLLALPLALLPAAPADAHGPTPQKVEESIEIGAPCELIWSTLLDFGSIGDWYPGLAGVEATGAAERGATRTITLANGESFTEKLDEVDRLAQALSYRLATENLEALPVSFYTARMALGREGPQGKSCKVEWSGRFYRGDTTNEPPPELSDEAAVAAMSAFFRTGLEGLKAKME